MTDRDLLQGLEHLRDLMISVATGGPRINEVNGDYQSTLVQVNSELTRRGIKAQVPYSSLWDWYGRWGSGSLPTWQSRRRLISELINPIIIQVQAGNTREYEPTGWTRVDRAVGEVRDRLAAAETEEQFQAVGLLCRETTISLAQAVYDPSKHPTLDGVKPSATDAKRRLEAYIAVEMAGGANEETRKHARSALDLANALQHRRTATFRDAALCVEATTSLINVISILSGLRDPK